MNNNIKTIESFFINNKEHNLFINIISDSVDIFYLYLLNHFAQKSNFKILKDPFLSKNDDLFDHKYVAIFETKSSRTIEDLILAQGKKIIFTTYQQFKNYTKKYPSVNSYNYKEDIRNFILNTMGIENLIVIENIINSPEFIYSEISKSLVYNNTQKNIFPDLKEDPIVNIRREIYQSDKDGVNLVKKYNLIKKELLYKKLNFLIY